MGTRSLTFVHDNDDEAKPIVCVYQQYDGYFDGVGDDILTFLKGSEVVNGIPMGDDRTIFNGSGDLAARLITHFKRGNPSDAGGVYIEAPDLADGDMGTEFAYHIYCTVGEAPRLVATDVYAKFTVEGPVSDFAWPQRNDDGDYVEAPKPLTEDQRRALFAAFGDVFRDSEQETRLSFTRLVLGKSEDEPVSWSTTKPGALSTVEAGQVLDALSFLGAAL